MKALMVGLLALYGLGLAVVAGQAPGWTFAVAAGLFAAWEVVAIGVFLEGSLSALLCRVFTYRDIEIDGDLYLRRWFLTPRSWPRRLFLHHILREDRARELHDHPFDFWTLGIKGRYAETVDSAPGDPRGVAEVAYMRPLRLRFRRAEHTHRIASVSDGGCWTLLLVSRARREWGFYTKDGWRSAVSLGIADEPEDEIHGRKANG